MGSFSWSANVCGRKLWYLLRPGAERHFSVNKNSSTFLEDIRKRRNAFSEAGVLEFIQYPGQILFIPSNWYHQVHNLDDCISINHNVINAFNVERLLDSVKKRLLEVRREIDDVKFVYSSEEFDENCQKILLIDYKINIPKLKEFMELVISDRLSQIKNMEPLTFSKIELNFFQSIKHGVYSQDILNSLVSYCNCTDFSKLCQCCSKFLCHFDLFHANVVNQHI